MNCREPSARLLPVSTHTRRPYAHLLPLFHPYRDVASFVLINFSLHPVRYTSMVFFRSQLFTVLRRNAFDLTSRRAILLQTNNDVITVSTLLLSDRCTILIARAHPVPFVRLLRVTHLKRTVRSSSKLGESRRYVTDLRHRYTTMSIPLVKSIYIGSLILY